MTARVSSPFFTLMSVTTTLPPWRAISMALARPMPLPEPVTTQTLPSKRLPMGDLLLDYALLFDGQHQGRVVHRGDGAGVIDDLCPGAQAELGNALEPFVQGRHQLQAGQQG